MEPLRPREEVMRVQSILAAAERYEEMLVDRLDSIYEEKEGHTPTAIAAVSVDNYVWNELCGQ